LKIGFIQNSGEKMCACAHKVGKSDLAGLPRTCRSSTASTVSAGALAFIAFVVSAFAQQGDIAVTCTNPYSGATWQIKIDYGRSTVDSNPARINDTTIAWRDAKDGWNYTLDRKSGKLTVILASSTGGSFLYDQCKLEK
jgi:spore coat protein U-like protein